jgi:hypothetical protein
MKKVLLACVLMAGAAFAAQSELGDISHGVIPVPGDGFPGTDDVIVSQPFAYASLQNGLGFSSGNSWMLADDITPVADTPIGSMELWTIYAGGNPTTIHIEARNDAAGPGSTVLYTNDCTALVTTSTGLYQWGYLLMNTVATIDAAAEYHPVGGTKIWWALQTAGSAGPDYWLAAGQLWADQVYFSQDNGSSWVSSTSAWGAPYESFMILNSGVGLSADTWAGIKTSF